MSKTDAGAGKLQERTRDLHELRRWLEDNPCIRRQRELNLRNLERAVLVALVFLRRLN